jgi:hypothetical protein
MSASGQGFARPIEVVRNGQPFADFDSRLFLEIGRRSMMSEIGAFQKWYAHPEGSAFALEPVAGR